MAYDKMMHFNDWDIDGMSEEEWLMTQCHSYKKMESELENIKEDLKTMEHVVDRSYKILLKELFSKEGEVSLLKVHEALSDLFDITSKGALELPDHMPLIQRMTSERMEVWATPIGKPI